MVRKLAVGRPASVEEGSAYRPPAATDRGSAAESRAGAAEGCPSERLLDRTLDAAAGGRGDRANHRSRLSPGARLADSAGAGLDASEAGPASGRAGSGGDRDLGPGALAGTKKNAIRDRAWIIFEDESGFSLTPSVRRTWAPRGKTPVLVHRQRNWTRISAAAFVCYRWDGRRARLYVHLRPGSYNEESLIDVLKDLRRHFRGEKVLLLWDGLSSHQSKLMRSYLEGQNSWLTAERLPAYAPDLNPAEGLWANLKARELANRCDLEIADTVGACTAGRSAKARPGACANPPALA